NRKTVESRCVFTRENHGIFLAVYIARIRITVHANGTTVIREGHGTGEARGTSPGEVHDFALKASETDATKRALATFGRRFGLELYHKSKASFSTSALPPPPENRSAPIPRLSRDHRRQRSPSVFSEEAPCADHAAAETQPFPSAVSTLAPARIDK